MCPSHIWYLMLPSEVRPKSGNIDDPRATGKKRNARTMFPVSPSLRAAAPSFDTHLRKTNQLINNPIIRRIRYEDFKINGQSFLMGSHSFSPFLAAVASIPWKPLWRYSQNDQTRSAMNITKKSSSVIETIPRGPFTRAGFFHTVNRSSLGLLLIQIHHILSSQKGKKNDKFKKKNQRIITL